MKRYTVKTRNWYGNRATLRWLEKMPHERGDSYTDGDAKLLYSSDSLARALLVFAYWYALARYSGGWTYIKNNAKHPDGVPGGMYLSFYL